MLRVTIDKVRLHLREFHQPALTDDGWLGEPDRGRTDDLHIDNVTP